MAKRKKTLVLYHDDTDGFVAAWCARVKLGAAADYAPVNYGQPMPDLVGREDVYVLDFCYPRAETVKAAEMVKRLFVIDHHKTAAQEFMEDWPEQGRLVTIFDVSGEHSGATMSWSHFIGSVNTWPWFVDYVRDRDLWKNELKDTRPVNLYLQALPHDFKVWDGLKDTRLEAVASRGEAIEMHVDKKLAELAAEARTVGMDGRAVPFVNAPQMYASELLNGLAKGWEFAVGWSQRGDGKYVFQLRTVRTDVDVSAIAKRYGGGGHKTAAGFVLDKMPEGWAKTPEVK